MAARFDDLADRPRERLDEVCKRRGVHDALAKVYRRLPSGDYLGSHSSDEAAVALGEYFIPSNHALAER